MKVTFIYNDISMDQKPRYNFAIGYLSASLKQSGHEVSLLHLTRPAQDQELVRAVAGERPGLVGFSSTINTFRHDQAAARVLKRQLDLPIICGGVHPTLTPEEVLQGGAFDMICVGEGDQAIVELCDKMDQGGTLGPVDNIWRLEQGQVVRTPMRPLIADLDALPFMDRDLFDYPGLVESHKGYARVMISRGCPYNCTYCCNHKVMELYRGHGKFVRVKSVARVMQELEDLRSRYPFVKYLIFYDSIFPLQRRWLTEFSQQYSNRIGLPFSCNCRPDLITEKAARLLAAAGCNKIKFGLESGSEQLRREVLKRNISQQRLKDAFRLCRDQGMQTQSYNIIGIPHETPSTALSTIKLNAEVEADFVWRASFYPFPNTELYDLCKRENLLADHQYDTYFEGTFITQETITDDQVNFLFQYYYPLLSWYKLLRRLPPRARAVGEAATLAMMSSRIVPHGALAKLKKQLIQAMLKTAPTLMLTIMPPSDE